MGVFGSFGKDNHSQSSSTQNVTNNTDSSQSQANSSFGNGGFEIRLDRVSGPTTLNLTNPQHEDTSDLHAAIATLAANAGNSGGAAPPVVIPAQSVAGAAHGKFSMPWWGWAIGAGVLILGGAITFRALRK